MWKIKDFTEDDIVLRLLRKDCGWMESILKLAQPYKIIELAQCFEGK